LMDSIPRLGEYFIVQAYHLLSIPSRFLLETKNYAQVRNFERYLAQGTIPFRFEFQTVMIEYVTCVAAWHLNDVAMLNSATLRLNQAYDIYIKSENYKTENAPMRQKFEIMWKVGNALNHYFINQADSIKMLILASNKEDEYDRSSINPAPIIPAREILGSVLMEVKRHREALTAFEESLHIENVNRFNTYYGAAKAAIELSDTAKTRFHFTKLVAVCIPTLDYCITPTNCRKYQCNERAEIREARSWLQRNNKTAECQ
jgi:tetratricopeptide (TPR) repeat protein